ncbi:[protein-PII] uridylyltransferase [Desulfovibrio ferrophilus]|uniref:Bifunctional uridylyltransferase/uridylyl-removing enzyme n=1 Tax=Desulfovibrio ferrophilus TaxID=241368 RepID=A0A2Z6AUY0_9BACT|nr:[protein-PII] uridylyltransferase [Desulfovibrio ferrophilus]BBD07028.1 bifunctional uridylyltransferase/uridylyl-removing enzyme [Desulfovibrio ferrophilus]
MERKPSKAAKVLAKGRDELAARADTLPGDIFCAELTSLVDVYFQSRLREIWPKIGPPPEECPFAVVAVGGYGRRELCLRSDVDILLVYERRIPPQALDLAQSLFFPLWDMGCDLGHGFRSIKENLSLARKDFQVFASLLDARFVDGNPEVFDALQKAFTEKVAAKKKKAFCKWLVDANKERLNRFGDASTLLEPDLKRGIGGLRDYHQILWLGQMDTGTKGIPELLRCGVLTEAQAHVLEDNARFLLAVRNQLHAESGRRNDRLHMIHQEAIAKAMGFEDANGSLAVEGFMARLHREMAAIKVLHSSMTSRVTHGAKGSGKSRELAPGIVAVGGKLVFALPRGYPDDPMVLMEIFVCAAREGLPLSLEARGFVTGHLHLVGEHLSGSPEAARRFVSILTSGKAAQTLEQMMESGFLGAFVPEFGRVQDVVQFDTYHIHPVGWHTVEALRRLEGPIRQPDKKFADLRDSFDDLSTLLLGAFFHDVGKGLGGGHSEKGEGIARAVLKRWDWPEAAAQEIGFLVREHLVAFETATRRDLGDESVVAGCAGRVGDERHLNMLMLLTWADAGGTGPGAWTKWSASLLWELHGKVVRMLRRGRLATADAVSKSRRTLGALREAAVDTVNEEAVEKFLDLLPTRYTLSMPAEDILRHVDMVRRLKKSVEEAKRTRPGGRGGSGVVVVETRDIPESGAWEVAVAAQDDPRLFATIAGVLALHGINIVSAECFLWRDNTVVDVFVVSDPPEHLPRGVFESRVASSVRNAMNGQLSLSYRLTEKRRSPLARQPISAEPEIVLHNEASDFYTLIEIAAPDRVGLLYDVARAMLNLGLSIQLAKIATYGDQVADVFYVREEGGKVSNAERIREVRHSLMACLERS